MRTVGIHYKRWSYTDYDPPTFIRWARNLGYDQLELDGRALLEAKPLSLTRLGFEARSHMMDLSYTLSCKRDWDLSSLDEELRRAAVGRVSEVIKVIGSLGGGCLNGIFYASFPTRWDLRGQKEALLEQAVKSIKALTQVAADEDVLLNIKPINRYEHYLLPTASDAVELVQQINHPTVGVDLDTFHMNIEERDLKEAIISAGLYLKTLHVRENNQRRVGEGHIDWSAIREGLDEIRYDGPIVHNPAVNRPLPESPAESNLIRTLLGEE